jgi:hypothetical protein
LVPIVAVVLAILIAVPAVLASSVLASTSGPSGVRAKEWWLSSLNASRAWPTSTGAGITVAVLSTGVSATQPDLAGDVTTGPDYTDSGRYADGPYWGTVGTAVASIIAGHGHGTGDNSGIIGIAPRSKILSVRVTLEYNDPLNANSGITGRLPTAIADGIVYAVNHGAKVIDLPLDPGTFGLAGDGAAAGGSPAERSAVRYALAKDVVLIAPAGDNGSVPGQASYPAAYPGVLAVGATTRGGQLASFSNRGSFVSLTAPGVDLMAASMLPSTSYGYAPGYAPISTTSAASAMVAGVAALVVSKYPQLPPGQVVRALRASGSGGDVNAVRALSVAGTLSPRVAPTAAGAGTPAKSVKPVVRASAPAATAPRPNTSGLAGAVLRDAVFAICGLIVLGLAVLFVIRARRNRAQDAAGLALDVGGTGSGPAGHGVHGLHGQRRGRAATASVAGGGASVAGGARADDWRVASPVAGGSASSLAAGSAGSPAGGFAGSSAGGSAGSLAGGSAGSLAAGWPAVANWQGTGPGEVAHSPAGSASPVGSRRPPLAPLPRSLRSGSEGADAGSPPWAPAAEPDSHDSPVPVMPLSWLPSDQAQGLRVPGGMPDAVRAPGGFDGPDLTAPFAGRDVITQSSFGLAAAPVPADFAGPTEIFPAAADEDTDQGGGSD